MINNNQMITIEYLKDLFFEKYAGKVNMKTNVEVLVVLTRLQYEELNDDLMKISGNSILLLVDESEMKVMKPEEILYTKIHIPNICEFLVQLGDQFEFRLVNESDQFGEEDL